MLLTIWSSIHNHPHLLLEFLLPECLEVCFFFWSLFSLLGQDFHLQEEASLSFMIPLTLLVSCAGTHLDFVKPFLLYGVYMVYTIYMPLLLLCTKESQTATPHFWYDHTFIGLEIIHVTAVIPYKHR